MTTMEMPTMPTTDSAAPTEQDFGQQLRETTAAVRLRTSRFGARKTLDKSQKAQAAGTFGAEGEFLSAGKKLLDTKHPAYKAVTAVLNKAGKYWKSVTLPYPEDGIRLINRNRIEAFNQQMEQFQEELDEAVVCLNYEYARLVQSAAQRLGTLFNPSDYPADLSAEFDLAHEFPSVEPPDYLKQLSPELYEQQSAMIRARFDEAVHLAEQAFLVEMQKMVEHLVSKLEPDEDGKPKKFKDSAVNNLSAFFERFRDLNIGSSESLDQLVRQAQAAVRGVTPGKLRDNVHLRQNVGAALSGIKDQLDGMVQKKPTRAYSFDEEV